MDHRHHHHESGQDRRIRQKFGNLRFLLARLHLLQRITMAQLERVQAELESLQRSVDARQEADRARLAADTANITALTTLVADLRAQLEAGPPGLTETQGDELVARIDVIRKDVEDAAVVDPPIDNPPVVGETDAEAVARRSR